jgi:hypothetical protein
MAIKVKICENLSAISDIRKPEIHECEECMKTGDSWVHLRTCQQCGITLCCDSSPNQHIQKHAAATGHPVIISAEPNERWMWCYVDGLMVNY